jgi:Domain of Unknown Function (DUF326)
VSVREILETHPQPPRLDRDVLERCISECAECAAVCTSCADASLAEPDVQELVRCIRFCLDCSDVCGATGRVVTRQTEPDLGVLRAVVEACATACRTSEAECRRHAAHHEHCRLCAETCRSCAEACDAVAAAIR